MTALAFRLRPGLSPRTFAAFTPARLSDLAFWYDAARSPVVADNGAVERWDDLSDNANHAGQTSAGQRPSLTTDAAGRAVTRFDGTDDALLVDTPPDLSAGVTVFVVYRVRTAESFKRLIAAGPATGTDNADFFAFQYENAGEQELQLFARSDEADFGIVKPVDSTEVQYALFTIGAADLALRDLNGELTDTTTNAPFGTPAAIALGAGIKDGADFSYSAVDLYEVGLYNRVLSTSELDDVEQYLRRRHQLRWTPLHIGADLSWFHDVQNGPFALTGSDVDQWDDVSGNARHWSQSGSARPEKTTDADGRDVVRFDGVEDVMTMDGTLPALEPFTCAVVYRVRNRVDFEGVLSATGASGPDHSEFWTFQLASAASGDMRLFGRSVEDGGDELVLERPDSGQAQIAIWWAEGGTAELRDKAGAVTDAYAGTFGTPEEIFLGGRYTSAPDLFGELDVYATVGVARKLSAEDRQKLIDWAVIGWGI